jgi:NAD(P)-dependent dehydrogenase (short-subunit alcohol dehydrogenase family)
MRIIITGAASGIGAATAARLTTDAIGRGLLPRLVLADIARPQLEQAAADVRALGARVEIIVGDLSVPQFSSDVVALAKQAFGGLDALISNAGINLYGDLLQTTLEDFDRTFAVNTRPTWLLAKAAHPMLKAAKGCIVATCSIASHEPAPLLGAYSASKAALLMLIRQMAVTWGGDGIRSNCVSPGSTATSIGREPRSGPADPNRGGSNPLRMVATPEDQAGAIAFLVGPDARFINGADLLVDGGASTQLIPASGMAKPP